MSEELTLDDFGDKKGDDRDSDEHPRFGSLPDDWKIREISNIAEVVGGSTPSTSNEDYWGGGIPWATPTDITGLSGNTITETEDTITEEGLESASTHLLPPESVLMTSRATIGKCAINTVEMATNQGFKSLIPTEDIESWYLYYRMLDTADFLNSLGSGSTFDEVSKTEVQSAEIPVPTLSEQRKIATVLYTVDGAIEKTEEIISESNRIKEGLTQDLFTDGYFAHEEKHGDQWANFPKDWELVSIEELIGQGVIEKIMDGNHGERHPSSDDFVTDGVPFVTSNVVENSQVHWENCKRLEQDTVDNLRKGFAKPGDVLLTHKGHVGRVGRVPESVELAVLSPQVTYYRCQNGVKPEFLMYYFLSSHVQKQLQAHSTQTTRDYVGITKQKQLQIALPPEKEQKKIAEVLSSVDDYILRESKAKSLLKRLKRGLMQDLLSGKVRTTDTNIEVPEEIAQHG